MTLTELLRVTVDMDGSDLHLATDTPPQVRVHGALQRLAGAGLGLRGSPRAAQGGGRWGGQAGAQDGNDRARQPRRNVPSAWRHEKPLCSQKTLSAVCCDGRGEKDRCACRGMNGYGFVAVSRCGG